MEISSTSQISGEFPQLSGSPAIFFRAFMNDTAIALIVLNKGCVPILMNVSISGIQSPNNSEIPGQVVVQYYNGNYQATQGVSVQGNNIDSSTVQTDYVYWDDNVWYDYGSLSEVYDNFPFPGNSENFANYSGLAGNTENGIYLNILGSSFVVVTIPIK